MAARFWGEIRRYPRAIPVVAAVGVLWAIWVSGPGPLTPAVVAFAAIGAALLVIDIRQHRLPNALVFPLLGITVVLIGTAGILASDVTAVARALLGGLILGAGYLVLYLLSPSGLGLGDVKLAPVLGMLAAWYSWVDLALMALLPFLLGGVVALALLALRKAGRKTMIAFGPYMLLGAVVVLTWARMAPPA
ncbi:prepilin peptidase [Bogoriella caseilytica]|uniref:Leader peptidase (Prepilin peptidase)/N-methyltransferase n=1 Tax=Bogoriella caseilytica TaxID=56055 RepID=A0A3N2BC74_9MICO|nr:A24 family peptidase [Bogoriella caseilytica]ROR72674.1 leader peptidase (prepilin peptidase)/N-methyltransferase [Bogoriella caseilytica]